MESRRLLSGTTYYVSNSGSDQNSGRSAALPWQTAAKVDATTFQPGDTILFQRGGQWRESLDASSDGTAADPITYGAYGDATAAKPLFLGSDVLDPSAFSLVTGTTYSLGRTAAVNWVFSDGAFTREAQDAAGSSVEATDVTFVESTAGSFYDDAAAGLLYVNIGGTLVGHALEAATRDNAVYSDGQSHLVFDSLATSETALDAAGYGFRVQYGSDVAVTDCDSTLAGKHNYGFIDVTGITATGLTSSQCAPDAGYGGASAIAFFVDAGQGVDAATAQFSDCTFTDRDGPYPIFISHGNGTGGIGTLSLTDLVSTEGYGGGMYVYSTGPDERVSVKGGDIAGATVELDTDDSVIDGLTLTGSGAGIDLVGSDDVVQNCLLAGINPNTAAGQAGAIIDNGTGNTVRLSTFDWAPTTGAAVVEMTAGSGLTLVGNLYACPIPVDLAFVATSATVPITSDYNLYLSGSVFIVGAGASQVDLLLADWIRSGYDAHSAAGDPGFTDAAGGNFTLSAISPAIDVAGSAISQSPVPVTTDLAGNPRRYGGGYDAGAYEYQAAKPVVVAHFARRRRRPAVDHADDAVGGHVHCHALACGGDDRVGRLRRGRVGRRGRRGGGRDRHAHVPGRHHLAGGPRAVHRPGRRLRRRAQPVAGGPVGRHRHRRGVRHGRGDRRPDRQYDGRLELHRRLPGRVGPRRHRPRRRPGQLHRGPRPAQRTCGRDHRLRHDGRVDRDPGGRRRPAYDRWHRVPRVATASPGRAHARPFRGVDGLGSGRPAGTGRRDRAGRPEPDFGRRPHGHLARGRDRPVRHLGRSAGLSSQPAVGRHRRTARSPPRPSEPCRWPARSAPTLPWPAASGPPASVRSSAALGPWADASHRSRPAAT